MISAGAAVRLQDYPTKSKLPYYHPEKGFHEAPETIGVDDGFTSQTRPHCVLRTGPWKLVHFFEDDRNELYHIPTDLAEQNNRAGSEAEVTLRLRKQLDVALKASNARLTTVKGK